MPVPAPCPYPVDPPAVIGRLSELPAAARELIGEMAEAGRPFQATDLLIAGRRLPFRRFSAARGSGCTLEVAYEQGGYAHQWRTLRLRLEDGR